MPAKPTDKIHPTYLKEKATGNHAIDAYGYGRFPHLLIRLAQKYSVPPELLLVALFLWDVTVGSSDGMGEIALSQIPVRSYSRDKWLAAFLASGFFEGYKAKGGGSAKLQVGSLYTYENPTADEWDELFRRAEILSRFENWDAVSPADFAAAFADIRQPRPDTGAFFRLLEMLGRGQKRDKRNQKREIRQITTVEELRAAAVGSQPATAGKESGSAERTGEKGDDSA